MLGNSVSNHRRQNMFTARNSVGLTHRTAIGPMDLVARPCQSMTRMPRPKAAPCAWPHRVWSTSRRCSGSFNVSIHQVYLSLLSYNLLGGVSTCWVVGGDAAATPAGRLLMGGCSWLLDAELSVDASRLSTGMGRPEGRFRIGEVRWRGAQDGRFIVLGAMWLEERGRTKSDVSRGRALEPR